MEIRFLDSLSDVQARQLHALYRNEWWTCERSFEDVERMLARSDYLFGLCAADGGRLLAFARVLTDGVFKAFLFDVIVAPEARDHGLGRILMERVLEHPDLARVQHFELYCLPELVPYYRRWGFTPDVGDIVLLRRSKRPE